MSEAPKVRRAFMRRVWDDGTVEEHDLELRIEADGSAWLMGGPARDTSVAGRTCGEEFIVEWEDN
jgi:hypothetical protein